MDVDKKNLRVNLRKLDRRNNHIVGKATIYDMDVDTVGKLMATAGQYKILR